MITSVDVEPEGNVVKVTFWSIDMDSIRTSKKMVIRMKKEDARNLALALDKAWGGETVKVMTDEKAW